MGKILKFRIPEFLFDAISTIWGLTGIPEFLNSSENKYENPEKCEIRHLYSVIFTRFHELPQEIRKFTYFTPGAGISSDFRQKSPIKAWFRFESTFSDVRKSREFREFVRKRQESRIVRGGLRIRFRVK